MATRIQLRRGTAAAWTSSNPVLAAGEPAVETDTGNLKVGDGTTSWASLPYILDVTVAALAAQLVQSSRVSGDTTNRFERRADGSMAVGPGGATPLRNAEAFWVIDLGAEPTRHGVVIYTSSDDSPTSQGLMVLDHLGAPIFAVAKAGGPAVFGDNFRVFPGGDVLNHEVSLRLDGTIQGRKGDPAGGIGVLALGAATTPPTRNPDGSVDLDGSDTVAGAVLWVDTTGRVRARRATGPIDMLGGSVQSLFPPTAGVQGGDHWLNTGGDSWNFFDGTKWQRVAVDIFTRRPVTGSYTVVDADGYGIVLHSTAAEAHTITLPSDEAASSLVQDAPISWRQYGAGQITFAAGPGATLQALGSAFKSAGRYAEGRVTKTAPNTWLLSGQIAA